jgi:hypothetical protein
VLGSERRKTLDRNDFLAHIWAASESGKLIPACAWCGRLSIEGQWVAAPAGALLTIDERMTLSHSICPSCAGARLAQMEDRTDLRRSEGAAPG